MKNKKIIIGAIAILAFLVVGGVSYYASKNSNLKLANITENNLPQENQVVGDIKEDCLSTTEPWIKVVSPNERAVYTTGETVNVKWESCNSFEVKKVVIRLLNYDNDSHYTFLDNGDYKINDNGSFFAELPSLNTETKNKFGDAVSFKPGTNFKIQISLWPIEFNEITDYSDDFFTIKGEQAINLLKNGELCGKGIGDCEVGLKCAYPCGIPGCQNQCLPESTPPIP